MKCVARVWNNFTDKLQTSRSFTGENNFRQVIFYLSQNFHPATLYAFKVAVRGIGKDAFVIENFPLWTNNRKSWKCKQFTEFN